MIFSLFLYPPSLILYGYQPASVTYSNLVVLSITLLPGYHPQQYGLLKPLIVAICMVLSPLLWPPHSILEILSLPRGSHQRHYYDPQPTLVDITAHWWFLVYPLWLLQHPDDLPLAPWWSSAYPSSQHSTLVVLICSHYSQLWQTAHHYCWLTAYHCRHQSSLVALNLPRFILTSLC